MKKTKLLFAMLVILQIMMTACKEDKNEPDVPASGVVQNIIGSWLLSSSDADNQAVYEFTETSRLNVNTTQNGFYLRGEGFYSVDEDKATVTGSYSDDRDNTFYIDWIIKANKAFQIDFEQYDSQSFAGDASIYRIVATVEVMTGATMTPEYRSYTGQSNCSDFYSLDPSVATVDSNSGQISGQAEGESYVTFDAKNGKAAVKVIVKSLKSLQELIIGTWIYDNPTEHEWQRTQFYDNGNMMAEWGLDNNDLIGGTGTGVYTVSEEKVCFTVNTPDGIQIPQEWRIEMINDYDCTYACYSQSNFSGKYTGHRLLETINMIPGESQTTQYKMLVGDLNITGFKSHNDKIATVDNSGVITSKSNGRTYIDIITERGTGVIEVNVNSDKSAIPYDFQNCMGNSSYYVKDMLGNPDYEDETTMIYNHLSNTIDMVGVSLDALNGKVRGITISYNSNVKTEDVTSILNSIFIPFISQTTDTFKAYMDAEKRADASIGVTWDIPSRVLTYVNLATDLFPDYSILIGMTRNEVISKFGREPDVSNDQSQSYFFFDNKGVKIVSAYFTDFTEIFDKVRSVVTMLDDSLGNEQITDYLKKKYHYYPEYSTDEELVFVPKDQSIQIFYMPADKMIMYISTSGYTKSDVRTHIVAKLRKSLKSTK